MKIRNLQMCIAISFSLIATPLWAVMTDDIRDGTYLELEGNIVADKLVMAMEIEVVNGLAGQAVVKGKIISVDQEKRTINIAGVDVVADDDALVQDADNVLMEFTGFEVGRRGKAEGIWENGVIKANRVKLKRFKPGRENEIDLAGVATKVNRKGESFTVLGVEVMLTPTTVVEVE